MCRLALGGASGNPVRMCACSYYHASCFHHDFAGCGVRQRLACTRQPGFSCALLRWTEHHHTRFNTLPPSCVIAWRGDRVCRERTQHYNLRFCRHSPRRCDVMRRVRGGGLNAARQCLRADPASRLWVCQADMCRCTSAHVGSAVFCGLVSTRRCPAVKPRPACCSVFARCAAVAPDCLSEDRHCGRGRSTGGVGRGHVRATSVAVYDGACKRHP